MAISRQLAAAEQGFNIVQSFPEWRKTPVILGEFDPEGCAACSAKGNPQNSYRNGPLYAAYTLEALRHTIALANRERINLLGVVTWAFEFEDQPPFEGFRELATNGIDKPVLNAFRMLGMMAGQQVHSSSTAALRAEDVVRTGVRQQPEINVSAARNEREVDVLVWNYHDEDLPAQEALLDIVVSGLPAGVKRALCDRFLIDSRHSNAFGVWLEMGSPKSLSSAQHERLAAAGQLELAKPPEWVSIENGHLRLQFPLARQAVALIRLTW
jgi:xylan 1,4-beta-xylosidase